MLPPIRQLRIQKTIIQGCIESLRFYEDNYAQQNHHQIISDVIDYLHGEQEIVDKAIAQYKETIL